MLSIVLGLLSFVPVVAPQAEHPQATAQVLQFSPSPVDFGTDGLGGNKEITVTITNPTASDFPISAIGVSRNINTNLYIVSNTCGSSIPAGASCTAVMGYDPGNFGVAYAYLYLGTTGGSYQVDLMYGKCIH